MIRPSDPLRKDLIEQIAAARTGMTVESFRGESPYFRGHHLSKAQAEVDLIAEQDGVEDGNMTEDDMLLIRLKL